jgi:hypothetical protein
MIFSRCKSPGVMLLSHHAHFGHPWPGQDKHLHSNRLDNHSGRPAKPGNLLKPGSDLVPTGPRQRRHRLWTYDPPKKSQLRFRNVRDDLTEGAQLKHSRLGSTRGLGF